MSRAPGWIVASGLASMLACGPPSFDDGPAPSPERPPVGEVPPQLLECRASTQTFVRRTLPWLHGRNPVGAAEVAVLAQLTDALDDQGADGRHHLAVALARGPQFLRRWQAELFDLLRVRRDGHRVLLRCHGETGPAASTPELARFVLTARPTEPYPGGPWSMRDLVDSSLLADDLRPILLADLLVRVAAPIDDANTSADDLEQARRINLGRNFEAVYLGRRMECLGCHGDTASVTDHPDPALDRFWPVTTGLERLAIPTDEASFHAVFRYEGFAEQGLAPWGADGCGSVAADRERDPFTDPAWLGGHLPAGAQSIDLMERLRRGFARLDDEGWSSAPTDGEQALAQLVVLHWVDGLWASATGRRLTLDHGTPRNAAQAQRLRRLATVAVHSGFSIRALLTEIAVDLHLDQAAPGTCEGQLPEPLPPIFDPFVQANGVGHLVHRRPPLALIDEAHRLFGQPLPGQIMGQPGFDSAIIGALGGYLRDVQPGHAGIDLLGLLGWETALDSWGQVPPAADDERAGPSIFMLVDAAAQDEAATFGDLAVAIKDRVLAIDGIDAEEQALVQTLTGIEWEQPVVQLDASAVREGALRYARVLIATPQFMLTGLFGEPGERDASRWHHPSSSPRAACEHWAPIVLADQPWDCADDGLVRP